MRIGKLLISIMFIAVAVADASAVSLGTRAADSTARRADSAKRVWTPVKYTFYFKVISSDKHPADEIFIDTSGQMRFNTHQQMKSGAWKTPNGFAYIEVPDDDTLSFFIRKNSLFEIDPADVSPECPDGDILLFVIYREDLKKKIEIRTNTCAIDYNLLTGEQRKLFPMLIQFLQRLADRYRPMFPE